MIYDLVELTNEFTQAIDQADAVRTSGRALLAIAERLDALREVQKPRFVEFETGSNGLAFINPQYVIDVAEFNENWLKNHKDHVGCVAVTTTAIDTDEAAYSVKGTLAEVMAKLRGDE